MATIAETRGQSVEAGAADVALRWSVRLLVGTVWLSSAIFGAYILALFVGGAIVGTPEDWNKSLPRLYVPGGLAANIGIGVHFLLGAVLLLLGPIQLMQRVRVRAPAWHRRIGWVYAVSAFATGIGGTVYILARGTIGGATMDVGFGLYGVLVVLASVQTVRHAMARRIEVHRRWAVRLYALAIGSWLYRMDYGFWMLFAGKLGRTETFDGPFDVFMIFWFYLPNLVVAELFLRARRPQAGPALKAGAAAVLAGTSLFVALATGFFTVMGWAPVIAWRMGF